MDPDLGGGGMPRLPVVLDRSTFPPKTTGVR